MASLAPDLPLPGLTALRGVTGPVTAARQRRSWVIYLALVAFGALPWAIGAAPGWQAFGLGLWFPGGGFIAVGGWLSLLIVPVLLLFIASLVAWFWAGAVVAPVLVWLGAAALAGALASDQAWGFAPVVVALLAFTVGFGFTRINARARAKGARQAIAREAFLPQSFAEVARQSQTEPDDDRREMDAVQLAGLRYLLDRALQPVDRFDGFTVIDQFQPAALRYQINHMGFALGIAQRAYVPAFRGYMGLAQRNLIDKYLERKVWDYWVLESCWGHLNFTDWNPAARDNIMLTGWFGAHVGQYMLATGDRRYMQPGSLTFRLNGRKAWAHDFNTIAGSVSDNYAIARFGLFACEPNWIYPICNHYGMLALVTQDALTGSRQVERHLPEWQRGLDAEFTDVSGSIVGLRSQFTGLPVPFPVGEAGYAHFANCFMPDRARQFWAIARREIEPLMVFEDEGQRIAMPGAGLDAGHYKPGHVAAYASYLVAAREFGDREKADAAWRGLEHDCKPDLSNGVLRFLTGSNISNATAIMGLLMDTGDFRRSFTEAVPAHRLAGPMIETLDYPDVLVARAWSDGTRLEAVLHPGQGPCRKAVPLSQLVPGARYTVTGAVENEIIASSQGEASITVDINGRTEITVSPRESNA
ncbi:MAG: hypothetical protein RIS85_1630 [Pseudomonadota bacterium]